MSLLRIIIATYFFTVNHPKPEVSYIPVHFNFTVMENALTNRQIKKDIENKDAVPQTYIVLQFKDKIHNEAVQWISCKIQSRKKVGGSELLVYKQPDIPGEVSFSFSYFIFNYITVFRGELVQVRTINK